MSGSMSISLLEVGEKRRENKKKVGRCILVPSRLGDIDDSGAETVR